MTRAERIQIVSDYIDNALSALSALRNLKHGKSRDALAHSERVVAAADWIKVNAGLLLEECRNGGAKKGGK